MAVELTGSITNATSEEAAYVKTNARIDNIIANGTPTEGNTELIDIRTGADGTSFSTAGSAVRGQISNANHQIDKLNSLSENFLALGVVPWTIRKHGYFRYDTGEFYDVTRYETGYATLYGASGQRFLYRGRGTGNTASVLYYDSNDNYLGGEQYNENYYREITVPTTIDNKNVNKVIFASCYDTSNTSYLTFEIYKFTNIIGNLYDRDSNLQSELNTEKTELIDIRTGADGTLFSTAGSAVRGQISNANYQIDKLNSLSENFLALGVVPWTIRKHGYFRYDTGEFYDVTRYETGYATLYGASGQRFLYRGRGTGSTASVLYYDSNDNYLGGEQYNENYYHEITVPTTIDNKNVNKVIFASNYDTSNTSYLTFEIYKFTNIIGKLYDRDSNLQSELNTEKTFTSNLSQQVNGLTTSVSDYDVAVKTMMGAVPYTNSKLNGYYKYDKDYNTVTFLNANSFASGYVTVDVNEGDIFLYRGRGVGNAISVVFYNANDEIVETMQFDETKFHEITIPSGVKKAFFTSYRNKNTAKKLTFDLYTPGTIKTLIDNQPSVSSSMTLNTANRLYASMTLGQAKHINNLDRAVVCIGFDDYNLDCLEGVQYLNSQNLKSYLALIPDNVTDNWNMAHVCYDNGGEIAAHSRTTLTSENQTFELMNEKFIQIPTIIGQHGFPVYGIIRAGGDNAGTENRSLDEFYCRAAGLKYSDYYGTVNPYRLTRENMTHKTLAEWQSYFDDLADRKGYAILYCHHLNGSETNAYTNGFTLSDFKAIVSEIRNRDIDVMTINEFVDKYIYGITGTDAFIR